MRRWTRYGAQLARRPRRRTTPTSTSMPAARSGRCPGRPPCGSGSIEADDDPADAGVDEGVGARAGATVVGAGLERGVERRARGATTGRCEGHDLGVGPARPSVAPAKPGWSGSSAGTTTAPTHGRGDTGGGRRRPRAIACRMRSVVGLCATLGSCPGQWARGPQHAPSLSSGLSPSAPEFHRIGPGASALGFADSHRRLGLAPNPARGCVHCTTDWWSRTTTIVVTHDQVPGWIRAPRTRGPWPMPRPLGGPGPV